MKLIALTLTSLALIAMPAVGIKTYKTGTYNAYTLRNDDFFASFYVGEKDASINLSLNPLSMDGAFDCAISLKEDGTSYVQCRDSNGKINTARLETIIRMANEFERNNQ